MIAFHNFKSKESTTYADSAFYVPRILHTHARVNVEIFSSLVTRIAWEEIVFGANMLTWKSIVLGIPKKPRQSCSVIGLYVFCNLQALGFNLEGESTCSASRDLIRLHPFNPELQLGSRRVELSW